MTIAASQLELLETLLVDVHRASLEVDAIMECAVFAEAVIATAEILIPFQVHMSLKLA